MQAFFQRDFLHCVAYVSVNLLFFFLFCLHDWFSWLSGQLVLCYTSPVGPEHHLTIVFCFPSHPHRASPRSHPQMLVPPAGRPPLPRGHPAASLAQGAGQTPSRHRRQEEKTHLHGPVVDVEVRPSGVARVSQ